MADDDSSQEKTEEPTPRKIEKAREEGTSLKRTEYQWDIDNCRSLRVGLWSAYR